MSGRLARVSAAALLACAVAACSGHQDRTATAPVPRDAIANLWQWPWPSVATECTTNLGPAGWGAVQVAPPADSLRVDKDPWWDVYQPVGYDLNSRFGNRAQFAAMVAACHAAGVKVYADAVINHMTGSGQTSTAGYGGATYSPDRHYPDAGYTPADFHATGVDCPTSDGQISDYNDQTQVQNCQLLGLLDLNTSSEHVRDQIAGYLNDLIGLGVDGFRIDAAKHIAVEDLAAIRQRLKSQPAWIQEVVPGTPPMSAYEPLGKVLEFNYAWNLRGQFRTGISGLAGFGGGGLYEPSDKAVVFVANHDTARDASTLSEADGPLYVLANVFLLAWNYGQPNVLSSFTFSDFDQSPPSDANGFVSPVTCGPQWTCVHRTPAISGAVGFHNATMGDATISNWWTDGSDVIAFSRGPAGQANGWIALNAGPTSAGSREFTTGLAAGTYCDVIHATVSAGVCTGPTVVVTGDGRATVSVPAVSAVAIDTASRV